MANAENDCRGAGQRTRAWGRACCFLALVLVLPRAAAAAEPLVLISPHTDAIRREFARGFSRWHEQNHGGGVEVEWRDIGGSSDALRFVLSEFSKKPEGIGIDCFFGGGLEPYLLLTDRQLALPYKAGEGILAGIPQNVNGVEIYDRNYAWYGAALSSFGILQNARVQKMVGLAPVTTWGELAKPGLFGWVGAGDPRNSGTMGVMFEAFLQYYGWEQGWRVLTQIGGNVRKFDRTASTTAKDVTLGETAYAFAIDFYGLTQVAAAGRSNVVFTLPKDFSAFTPDGIAILKGAPHLQVAQRFVDYVLSEDGQKLWFLPRGHPGGPQTASIERMSVRPEFYKRYRDVSNVEGSPFELPTAFRYNAELSRKRRDVVAGLIGALFVDTHPELKAAWKCVIARQLPPAQVDELGEVPVTEQEALELAARDWKNPAIRNQKKIEWQTWAQKKYRKLAGR